MNLMWAISATMTEVYRLKTSIRAVKLDSDYRGELTVLPPGCVVHVQGTSALHGFIEILCEGERVSVFREDLESKAERVSAEDG